MSKKSEYYSNEEIKKRDADYYVIFGERSNGKTYSVLEDIIEDAVASNYKNQGAIFRRFEEDFKGKNGNQQFDGFINNKYGNQIIKLTNGKYNSVDYASRRWYFANIYEDDKGKIVKEICEEPFCIGFSITSAEHYKSFAYPKIKTILFDEFITRKMYLPNEFIEFQNLLSTIIRDRDDVKIWMCGNTINKYCPHFKEMGLTHITQMKKGTIDIYEYGTSGLRVAVEYCDSPTKKGKKSDKYFAFDNPKLKMITTGEWEIDIYPHLPFKYVPKDVKYQYYIQFEQELLTCKIIKKDKELITFIHRKTTPINEDKSIVYTQEYSSKPNYRRKITNPTSKVEQFIVSFFKKDKVFYQDNEIGEIVNNYINWCKTN